MSDVLTKEKPVVAQLTAEHRAAAAWSAVCEPGDIRAKTIVTHFGYREALEHLDYLAGHSIDDADTIRETFAPVSLGASVAAVQGWVLRYRDLNLEMELDWLRHLGGTLLIPGDASWPTQLDILQSSAPLALWVRGHAVALTDARTRGAVALVGARAASRYGTKIAEEIAYELAERGVWVISGGAYGIDAAAHRGALAATGKTISVQAGGLGELYPAMNASLFSQIEHSGAIISESPCSMRPAKRLFLIRNRLIAALSQAVVVVEAGQRSGAVSTANHGLDQGREVAAVPGPVTSMSSVGCHNLIRQGAALVTCAKDILELLTVVPAQSEPETETLFSGLDANGVKVIDSLHPTHWQSVEQIARAAGLGIATVRQVLGLLELCAKAENQDGRYRLNRHESPGG